MVMMIVGFFVAPAVALACALLVFVAAYVHYWRGVLACMRQPTANEEESNKPLDVWDKHIARLEAQKQNRE